MPLILYNLALAYYKKEEYTEAIKAFNQIGSTLSNNYFYWYRLGICYYKIYIKKIENRYRTCQNGLFTKSQNYPKPLQRSGTNQSQAQNQSQNSAMKSTTTSNSNIPQNPQQSQQLNQQQNPNTNQNLNQNNFMGGTLRDRYLGLQFLAL